MSYDVTSSRRIVGEPGKQSRQLVGPSSSEIANLISVSFAHIASFYVSETALIQKLSASVVAPNANFFFFQKFGLRFSTKEK